MHDTTSTQDVTCVPTPDTPRYPGATGTAPAARRRPHPDGESAVQAVERDRVALVRFARRFTARREDAEDAVQSACLIALRRPDVTGPTAVFWLKAVIRREAHRRRRAAARTTAVIDRALATAPAGAAAADVHEQAAALLDLRAALSTCKPDERRALAGRVAGYSYREIAAREDWTYTKVNRAISEGRARLRALVAA